MNYWQRAVLLIDMDAFFASVEQMDFAHLRGKPVAVTNGDGGTTIITCSYEAREFGIKTGMKIYKAQKLCPQLIKAPSRPYRYTELSRKIMRALENNISPEIEFFSIDEAFLEVTGSQKLLGTPQQIAEKTRSLVKQVSGVTCSVGVGANKAVAKFAATINKPDGVCVIRPEEAAAILAPHHVTELCGIGRGIANFLAQFGVTTCGQLAKLPVSVLGNKFGNLGRRLWLNAQGKDLEPLNCEVQPPKSLGHGKMRKAKLFYKNLHNLSFP
jgi:DNA polymerase-4